MVSMQCLVARSLAAALLFATSTRAQMGGYRDNPPYSQVPLYEKADTCIQV